MLLLQAAQHGQKSTKYFGCHLERSERSLSLSFWPNVKGFFASLRMTIIETRYEFNELVVSYFYNWLNMAKN